MEKHYYKVEHIDKNNVHTDITRMSSTFPTLLLYNRVLGNKDTLIVYLYIKDINGNYIVTDKQIITNQHKYFMNKFIIKHNLKKWLIAVNKPNSLFNNMNGSIKFILNEHVSMTNITRNNGIIEGMIIKTNKGKEIDLNETTLGFSVS